MIYRSASSEVRIPAYTFVIAARCSLSDHPHEGCPATFLYTARATALHQSTELQDD